MSLRKHKIIAIAILWAIIIFIFILFPSSIGKPQNNGYYTGIFAILCFFIKPDIKIGIISLLSFIILLICSKDVLHPIMDFITILLTLTGLEIALSSKINKKEIKFIFLLMSIYVILDIIGLAMPSLYAEGNKGDMRYSGILHSSNVSATIFCLCQIAINELKKYSKQKIFYIYCNFALFALMLFITKTRSMLFFLPYWIIQFYNFLDKRLFWCIITVFSIIILKSIIEIQENLRLEEDGSYVTRSFLYENLINEILNNPLIPHGSNEANKFSKELTMSDEFSSHNDFLKYLYDWGGICIILLVYVWISYKRKIKFSWSILAVIIGWSSASLHNILLLPQVLFVLFIILNINYNYNKIRVHKSRQLLFIHHSQHVES